MRIMRMNKPEWPYFVGGSFGAVLNGLYPMVFALLLGEILEVTCVTLLCFIWCALKQRGCAVARSLLLISAEVPCSIPGLVEGWISLWPSFPLKFTHLFILPRSVKWIPECVDRLKAAPIRGAYISLRSAGSNLVIVMCLWAYSYGKGAI